MPLQRMRYSLLIDGDATGPPRSASGRALLGASRLELLDPGVRRNFGKWEALFWVVAKELQTLTMSESRGNEDGERRTRVMRSTASGLM